MVSSLVPFSFSFYSWFFFSYFFFFFYININNKFPCISSTGHTIEQFEEFFCEISLGRYISEASKEMQIEFFHRYLQDFISMTMKVTSEVDLKVRAHFNTSSACPSTNNCLCVDMVIYLFLPFSSYVEPLLVV